jgi:hypothetical protein
LDVPPRDRFLASAPRDLECTPCRHPCGVLAEYPHPPGFWPNRALNGCARDRHEAGNPRELCPERSVTIPVQADEDLAHPSCGYFWLRTHLRVSLLDTNLERMSIFGQHNCPKCLALQTRRAPPPFHSLDERGLLAYNREEVALPPPDRGCSDRLCMVHKRRIP